jgi:LCT (Lysosomal Cystine Transporter) family transporter
MHASWPLALLALSGLALARTEASTHDTTVIVCEHGTVDHTTGTCECARFWSGVNCSEATEVRHVWLYWATEGLGWVYFSAWSFSFVPQCILNYKRQSVVGLSFAFLAYNLTGFLFYTAFSAATYGLETARGVAPDAHSIRPQDLAFGGFAITMTLITMVQCCVYERAGQGVGRLHATVVGIMWGLLGLFITLCLRGVMPWAAPSNAAAQWSLLFYMGLTKTVITAIKGLPQAYLNYQRKSTVGWSIINILLDLTGTALAPLTTDPISPSTEKYTPRRTVYSGAHHTLP